MVARGECPRGKMPGSKQGNQGRPGRAPRGKGGAREGRPGKRRAGGHPAHDTRDFRGGSPAGAGHGPIPAVAVAGRRERGGHPADGVARGGDPWDPQFVAPPTPGDRDARCAPGRPLVTGPSRRDGGWGGGRVTDDGGTRDVCRRGLSGHVARSPHPGADAGGGRGAEARVGARDAASPATRHRQRPSGCRRTPSTAVPRIPVLVASGRPERSGERGGPPIGRSGRRVCLVSRRGPLARRSRYRANRDRARGPERCPTGAALHHDPDGRGSAAGTRCGVQGVIEAFTVNAPRSYPRSP